MQIKVKNGILKYSKLVYTKLEGETTTQAGKLANVILYPDSVQKQGTKFNVKVTGDTGAVASDTFNIMINKNGDKRNLGTVIVNGSIVEVVAPVDVETIYIERSASSVTGAGTIKLEVEFVYNPAV